MVLCKPVDEYSIQEKINQAIRIQDDCFAISKRTLSLQSGNSEGNTHTDTFNETKGTNKNKGSGANLSGAIPGMLLGAKIGSVAGMPVPIIGNALGLVGGGLIGLVVGQQLNFSKNSSKGTTYSISKGYSDAVTKTISESESISGDIQNGFALELMKMAESMTERLKVGRSIGMWESIVTYSSDSKIASDVIQGSLYSEIASGIPEVLPPVVFSYKDTCIGDNLPTTKIHNQQLMIPKGFFDGNGQSPLCSLVTSEELCGICTIPVDNTVGFEIKESRNYSLNYSLKANDKELGYVCEYDRPLKNMPFGLSEYDLNKHTFVCGITGSGKTNTVKKILESVEKPFMIIEPAKKEYRNIKKSNTNVYTLGRLEINCLKINPFYILPGISPQQHIDMLKDLFSASFAFYGPMPYILEKCIYNIYNNRGWNLTLGFHPCLVDSKNKQNLFEESKMKEYYNMSAHKYVFPTMQNLKDEIDRYIEKEMTYEGEIKGNIRGAMKARIDSLCVGSKGYMFNTHDMVDMGKLLETNSVLELEGLADDADKAFALGLLIMYVNEYRQVQKEVSGVKGLKHLLVIEEAHRLLKNTSIENNEDIGNPKGKAVDHFTNMLAEMRSYGQGVIVAEQIPSKLAPDVIKNSSNKIVHRIVAKDDQENIANTIGIYMEDAISLGNSKVGYALCHKEGMAQPVIVKIDEVGSNQISDVNLYNKDIDRKMLQINQSIVNNQLSKEMATWSVKALVSLLFEAKQKDIYDGLEVAYEQISHSAILKSITMIPGVDKKKCIMKSIAQKIISLMIYGVFSNNKLPSDNLVALIESTIQNPTETKLKELQMELEKFYRKKPSKKVVETVAGLYVGEFVDKINITNAVNDFCLVKNMVFVNEVLSYLNERVK
ncbi:ATP-binding protein [Lachnoanaerobaculum sp. Marseille-Q4761]|uniref:ATP-binding protein n=1 Tax=Lachnoanaerobaculum sp. Marseille-Q4761 TaxID=2819511 RepID=UPI001AA1AED6|nr:ATP-binding protein [Lachnoanaerobaculum sp. Marseille-Q4761]MBO1869752.1 ATP-binding protein [Lachnoanaerobaculum sp. Marseille-Q4761]